jgi:hypothetical protein
VGGGIRSKTRHIVTAFEPKEMKRLEDMSAVRAPALPVDAVWLNVERPLTPADLRGRLVLLDFWTYG